MPDQYDYVVKDHLGNVRMLLTEEEQKDIYPIASLENTEAVNLEKAFYNIYGVNIVDKSAAMQIVAGSMDWKTNEMI